MFFCYLTQSAGRTHVADGVAWRMLQHKICDSYQGVFLAEPTPILTYKCQSIHIRIHTDTQMTAMSHHRFSQIHQMVRKRFWVVRKISRWITMNQDYLTSHSFQKDRDDDASTGIHKTMPPSASSPGTANSTVGVVLNPKSNT